MKRSPTATEVKAINALAREDVSELATRCFVAEQRSAALARALAECVTELESYEQDRSQRELCESARALISRVQS